MSGPPLASASPTTPAPTPSNTITLQVGECRFVTRPATLTRGSDFFARQLSGRWPDIQPDGSYFLDADGDVFQHVLRYLRHEIMPLFYDNVKGYDYGLYLAVLEQARYFGVEPLQKWLERKTYLQAVKIVRSARMCLGRLGAMLRLNTMLHGRRKRCMSARGVSPDIWVIEALVGGCAGMPRGMPMTCMRMRR